jgi:hypothetical protein
MTEPHSEYSEAKGRWGWVCLVAIYSTSSFMSASVSLTPTVVLVRCVPSQTSL